MTATKSRKNRRPTQSQEQRIEQAKALQTQLVAEVETLASSERWTQYLDFMRSFHRYSFANLMLILAQCPEATLCAGFRQWQAKGRQVRKGERAIKIRGFSSKKITETNEETGEETERRLARFPILSVFDVSQTDAIEGAEQPSHPTQRLTGDDAHGIYEAMAAHMTAQGWSVTREAIPGETNGYTTTDGSRRIVVDANLEPAQAAKTMLHEAAHATLHVDETGKASRDLFAHHGIEECEAESVAYVLAGLLGVDTSAYSVGYVTGWTGGDVDTIRQTAENVLRAVQTLAPALLDDPAEAAA
jgi:antirestriction protein ArdC